MRESDYLGGSIFGGPLFSQTPASGAFLSFGCLGFWGLGGLRVFGGLAGFGVFGFWDFGEGFGVFGFGGFAGFGKV